MIKRIKDSLAAKVFLLSLLLLILCGFLTYLLIAIFMPKTYSLYLNDALAEKAQQFVSRLETVDFDSSGALFDSFIGNPDISTVELIDENGTSIPLPSLQNTYTGSTVILSDHDLGEPTTTQSFDFSFLNDNTQYTLIVYGTAESFADRFDKYKEFGIEYVESENASGTGNIYYNGKLVKYFLDLSPSGDVFTFQSTDGGSTNVQTIYENDKIVGVKEME